LRENKNKANFANNLTYIVSAIWHGFYPGYFISAINMSFLTIANKFCFNISKFTNFNFDRTIFKPIKLLLAANFLGFV
jgi:lysophospholipid acyltransferase